MKIRASGSLDQEQAHPGLNIAAGFTLAVMAVSSVYLASRGREPGGGQRERAHRRDLHYWLLVPGIAGAVLGTIVITQLDGKALKPYVTAYLLMMGLYILSKAFRRFRARAGEPGHIGKLAAFGGFVDAAGGGGWGPVVTSTLVGSGRDPRTTIGSVNFAEFFITVATAASFSLLVGPGTWVLVAGLVVGGLFAAPFAALLCKRLRARTLLVLAGTLISALSAYNLCRFFLFA